MGCSLNKMIVNKSARTNVAQIKNNKKKMPMQAYNKNISSEHCCFKQNGNFNKYLLNFTGLFSKNKQDKQQDKIFSLDIKPSSLVEIYVAAKQINNEDSKALIEYIGEKLEEKVAVAEIATIIATKNDVAAENAFVDRLKSIDNMYVKDDREEKRVDSAKALGIIGAVTKDQVLFDNIIEILTNYDAQCLKDKSEEVRASSAEALGKMGVATKNVDLQDKIANELMAPGKGINDNQQKVRGRAVEALGSIGAAIKDVGLQGVIATTLIVISDNMYIANNNESEQFYVGGALTKAFGKMGAAINDTDLRGKVIGELTADGKGINDNDQNVAAKSTLALGEIRSALKDENALNEIITSLIEPTKGINHADNLRCLYSLEVLGPLVATSKDAELHKKVVTELTREDKGLNSSNPAQRRASVRALGLIGAATKDESLQRLIIGKLTSEEKTGINDRNYFVKLPSVKALGLVGVATKDKDLQRLIIDNLSICFNQNSSRVKIASIRALKNIALKKGSLLTSEKVGEKDGKPIFKTLFTKVLEEVKNTRELTNDPNIYAEAVVAQKDLEARNSILLGISAFSSMPSKNDLNLFIKTLPDADQERVYAWLGEHKNSDNDEELEKIVSTLAVGKERVTTPDEIKLNIFNAATRSESSKSN